MNRGQFCFNLFVTLTTTPEQSIKTRLGTQSPSRPAVARSGVGAQHRRATAAAPWSVRVRDNAPVAIPLL